MDNKNVQFELIITCLYLGVFSTPNQIDFRPYFCFSKTTLICVSVKTYVIVYECSLIIIQYLDLINLDVIIYRLIFIVVQVH